MAVAEPVKPGAALPMVDPTPVEVVASDRKSPQRSKKLDDPAVQKALTTVDPSRVFDTAEAKPGVPQLAIVGPTEQRIAAGESVALAVQAAPDAVVTFATSDGGEFSNHAASITVLADDQGLAQAVMTAPRGTLDDVPVHVGSPGAVGTVTLLVHVFYAESPLHTLTAQ